MRSVCVFCGSSAGEKPVFREAAGIVGQTLARRKLRLIYGGGNVGLMGAVADAVLAAGGEVVGVIPQALLEKELAHEGLTELIVVQSMHERKALMADRADAFLALPGGYGTFEEFCEVLTWAQLGLHAKPCGLLNVDGFYDALLGLFDRAVDEGFLRTEHRSIVTCGTDVEDLLDLFATYQPPVLEKWIDRSRS
jgi:uncharacterized protein (TIGR00730 family)